MFVAYGLFQLFVLPFEMLDLDFECSYLIILDLSLKSQLLDLLLESVDLSTLIPRFGHVLLQLIVPFLELSAQSIFPERVLLGYSNLI
jgi:hypothetical protein